VHLVLGGSAAGDEGDASSLGIAEEPVLAGVADSAAGKQSPPTALRNA
jgi:hypothetical protein